MLYFWIFIYAQVQTEISDEVIALISYVIFFLVTLISVFILFFIMFQKRKNQILIEKFEAQKRFQEELVKTKQEIQEATLKHVGRELHDNIGQTFVYAQMQLANLARSSQPVSKETVENIKSTLHDGLSEVRSLSKSLNADVLFNLDFEVIIKSEIQRLEKLGEITTSFNLIGRPVKLTSNNDKLMLFRIAQEFISNTIKYAEADKIEVTLNYSDSNLVILINDNGKGFDSSLNSSGSGLITMEKRAELIKTKFQLTSKLNEGTQLQLTYSLS